MIAIAVFTEPTSDNACEFLTDGIHIENISSDDYLDKNDFDYLEEAIQNIEMDKYKSDEWYQLTFKRQFEDDGSGARRFDWFELIESIKITQH